MAKYSRYQAGRFLSMTATYWLGLTGTCFSDPPIEDCADPLQECSVLVERGGLRILLDIVSVLAGPPLVDDGP
jgi:hypothetical protein